LEQRLIVMIGVSCQRIVAAFLVVVGYLFKNACKSFIAPNVLD